LDVVRFLKLEVPQLYLPIHLKTKAHKVSEMTGIFGLRKCRVCNILVTTMPIWLTQPEFFKLELQVYVFASLCNPNKMLCSRKDCCSESAAMPSLCIVDLRVTVNADLSQ